MAAQALDPDWQPSKRRWLPLILISSLIWPVLLLLPLLERPFEAAAPIPEFAVTGDHLLESLTVAEIEARERVSDPLGAVPDLPFGHLNTAWCEFLARNSHQAVLRCPNGRSGTAPSGSETRSRASISATVSDSSR